jgi:hypothetical protein
MYKWYQDAQVCYIYINDAAIQSSWNDTAARLRKSRWFTRGWTLQELLAPRRIKFYDRNWRFLGGRFTSMPKYSEGFASLLALVSEITSIDVKVIMTERPVHSVLVAE